MFMNQLNVDGIDAWVERDSDRRYRHVIMELYIALLQLKFHRFRCDELRRLRDKTHHVSLDNSGLT